MNLFLFTYYKEMSVNAIVLVNKILLKGVHGVEKGLMGLPMMTILTRD